MEESLGSHACKALALLCEAVTSRGATLTFFAPLGLLGVVVSPSWGGCPKRAGTTCGVGSGSRLWQQPGGGVTATGLSPVVVEVTATGLSSVIEVTATGLSSGPHHGWQPVFSEEIAATGLSSGLHHGRQPFDVQGITATGLTSVFLGGLEGAVLWKMKSSTLSAGKFSLCVGISETN